MNNELSILWHYINSCPSVQARRACCSAFPAFLLPLAQKLRLQGEDLLEVKSWWGLCRVMVVLKNAGSDIRPPLSGFTGLDILNSIAELHKRGQLPETCPTIFLQQDERLLPGRRILPA